jgi:sRNA-binding protein
MDRKEPTKDPLEAAVHNLEKADADLRLAQVADPAAERKLADAEQQIEELAEELARESKIKVNGRTRTVEGREVSFEEVVKLAFPNGPTKPNTKFTVTFRNAAQVPAMGELDAGESVKVKRGHNPDNETIFNVTETVLS